MPLVELLIALFRHLVQVELLRLVSSPNVELAGPIGLKSRVKMGCLPQTRHFHFSPSTTAIQKTSSITRGTRPYIQKRYGQHIATRGASRPHSRIARMETESTGISSQWRCIADERYLQGRKRSFANPENGTRTSATLFKIGYHQDSSKPWYALSASKS